MINDPKEIVRRLYDWYASDTGTLFGLPGQYREAVECIIIAACRIISEQNETQTQ